MSDQLPAIVQPSALAQTDTYIVPPLIAAAGDAAGWRYIEFFTANIHNDHTRPAAVHQATRQVGEVGRLGGPHNGNPLIVTNGGIQPPSRPQDAS
jgi:hypothetical protein